MRKMSYSANLMSGLFTGVQLPPTRVVPNELLELHGALQLWDQTTELPHASIAKAHEDLCKVLSEDGQLLLEKLRREGRTQDAEQLERHGGALEAALRVRGEIPDDEAEAIESAWQSIRVRSRHLQDWLQLLAEAFSSAAGSSVDPDAVAHSTPSDQARTEVPSPPPTMSVTVTGDGVIRIDHLTGSDEICVPRKKRTQIFFRLFKYLVSQVETHPTYSTLKQAIWGAHSVEDHTLQAQICKLKTELRSMGDNASHPALWKELSNRIINDRLEQTYHIDLTSPPSD
jgi:hypothetical protein